MTQDITSLIEKLEGATEGSRELDGAVWYAVHEPDVEHGCLHVEQTDQGPIEVLTCELGSKYADCVSKYSTSIDAALALAGRLGHDVFGMMADVIERLEREGWSGFPTPGLQSAFARYFCAAILRAQSEARV